MASAIGSAPIFDWALAAALKDGVDRAAIITDDALTLLAAKLKTPLQIGRHLVRAFEAGFEAGVKPVDQTTVETVLSRLLDDLGATAHPARLRPALAL